MYIFNINDFKWTLVFANVHYFLSFYTFILIKPQLKSSYKSDPKNCGQ